MPTKQLQMAKMDVQQIEKNDEVKFRNQGQIGKLGPPAHAGLEERQTISNTIYEVQCGVWVGEAGRKIS